MEVKREDFLITITGLDMAVMRGLQSIINDFIRIEKADVFARLWELESRECVVDIYCESELVIKRLEEWLNEHGYVLRLTSKPIIAT